MSNQNFYVFGLKSLMECISRAVLLSQPTNIPDFIQQYMLGIMDFRESHPESDPKIAAFNYQELWEIQFLRKMRRRRTTSTDHFVPSPEELEEAQKMLFTDLASSRTSTKTTASIAAPHSVLSTEEVHSEKKVRQDKGTTDKQQTDIPQQKSQRKMPLIPKKVSSSTDASGSKSRADRLPSTTSTTTVDNLTKSTEKSQDKVQTKKTVVFAEDSKSNSREVSLPPKTSERITGSEKITTRAPKTTIPCTRKVRTPADASGSKSRAVSLPSKTQEKTTNNVTTEILKTRPTVPPTTKIVSTPADASGSKSRAVSLPSKSMEKTTEIVKTKILKSPPTVPPTRKLVPRTVDTSGSKSRAVSLPSKSMEKTTEIVKTKILKSPPTVPPTRKLVPRTVDTSGSKSRAVSLPSKSMEKTTEIVKTKILKSPPTVPPTRKLVPRTVDTSGSKSRAVSLPSKSMEKTTEIVKTEILKSPPTVPPTRKLVPRTVDASGSKSRAVRLPSKSMEKTTEELKTWPTVPPTRKLVPRTVDASGSKSRAVGLPNKPLKTTSNNLEKISEKTQTIVPPILKKKCSHAEVSASKSNTASHPQNLLEATTNRKKTCQAVPPVQKKNINQTPKPSHTPKTVSQKLVLPPVTQKMTRVQPSVVKGKDLTAKSSMESKINREVEYGTPKTSAPMPKVTDGPKKPEPESTSTRHTQPKTQKPKIEKIKSCFKILPDKPQVPKVPWEDTHVGPEKKERKIHHPQGSAAASSCNHTCPHPPLCVVRVIKYKRMQIVATQPQQ
ncbi:titin-like [Notolabrus celidotus]|uniref:titin-like n=1 Tax=Notolabrus celidotus TaxID=1203425 RepID=UPI00148FC922|nr:titin-like [Notolabrus celidotus]